MSAGLDIEAALESLGFGRFQWVTLLLSGIGFGAATVELVSVSQLKPLIKDRWNIPTQSLTLLNTCMFAGEIAGGLLWGWFSDQFGREPTFFWTSGLMAVTALAQMTCINFTQLCLVRALLGVAIGGSLSVDFVYFLECVPATRRAFRTAYIILIGILGLLYSAACGWLFLDRAANLGGFLGVCAVPSAVLLGGRCFWRFESPKFLAAKGRFVEARQVLEAMARFNDCNLELVEKKSSMAHGLSDQAEPPSISLWRRIVSASVVFCCQSSAYYGLTLWIGRFMDPRSVSVSTAFFMIGLAELPGLAITAAILKHLKCGDGKSLCSLLSLYFAVSSVLAASVAYIESRVGVMLGFCLLYCFIVSIWTLIYSSLPELFPVSVRSRCFGLAGMGGKMGGLLGPVLFGWLLASGWSLLSLHWLVSMLFALGSLASLALC